MGISGAANNVSAYEAGSAKKSGRLGREEQAYLNGLKEKYPEIQSVSKNMPERIMMRYLEQGQLLTGMGR